MVCSLSSSAHALWNNVCVCVCLLVSEFREFLFAWGAGLLRRLRGRALFGLQGRDLQPRPDPHPLPIRAPGEKRDIVWNALGNWCCLQNWKQKTNPRNTYWQTPTTVHCGSFFAKSFVLPAPVPSPCPAVTNKPLRPPFGALRRLFRCSFYL